MKKTNPKVKDDFVLIKLHIYNIRRASKRIIFSMMKIRKSLPIIGEFILLSTFSLHLG